MKADDVMMWRGRVRLAQQVGALVADGRVWVDGSVVYGPVPDRGLGWLAYAVDRRTGLLTARWRVIGRYDEMDRADKTDYQPSG